MSDERPKTVGGRFQRFVKNFGKVPDAEPVPLLPQRWRMPVFLGMVVVGIVVLLVFVWFVVMPAISSESVAPKATSTTLAPDTSAPTTSPAP